MSTHTKAFTTPTTSFALRLLVGSGLLGLTTAPAAFESARASESVEPDEDHIIVVWNPTEARVVGLGLDHTVVTVSNHDEEPCGLPVVSYVHHAAVDLTADGLGLVNSGLCSVGVGVAPGARATGTNAHGPFEIELVSQWFVLSPDESSIEVDYVVVSGVMEDVVYVVAE